MISVQNHLLPLSGNNIVILVIAVLLMQSCSVSKPVSVPKDAQIVKAGGKTPPKDKSDAEGTQPEKIKKITKPLMGNLLVTKI